ncbi:hypothetical protein HKX48_006467 [Thoreauomyces humboldtii]|nr:hypothetical protein HKX48_006467 [Thoreauomyces humboldtii]
MRDCATTHPFAPHVHLKTGQEQGPPQDKADPPTISSQMSATEIAAPEVEWEGSSKRTSPHHAPYFLQSLQLKALQVEAKLNVSSALLDTPVHASLLAVSSLYGYVVCGTTKGFAFAYLKDVRTALKDAVKNTKVCLPDLIEFAVTDSRVHHVKLSADELVIVICTAAGILSLYDIKPAGQGKIPTLLKQFSLSGPALEVLPNPSESPDTAAVLLENGTVQIISFTEAKTVLPLAAVKSICWSKKGKQLACGLKDGSITQMTPEGIEKKRIPKPSALGAEYEVFHIHWPEASMFMVFYGNPDDPYSDCPLYIISQTGTPKVTTYVKLQIPLYVDRENTPNHFFIQHLKALGGKISHLLILGSSTAPDVRFAGCDHEGNWGTWSLAENEGIVLPLNESEEQSWLLGLAIDNTSEDTLVPDDPDDPPTKPVPIVLTYSSDGNLMAYHCLDKDAVKENKISAAMCTSNEIPGSIRRVEKGANAAAASIPTVQLPAVSKAESNPDMKPTSFSFGTTAKPGVFGSAVADAKTLFGSGMAPTTTSHVDKSVAPKSTIETATRPAVSGFSGLGVPKTSLGAPLGLGKSPFGAQAATLSQVSSTGKTSTAFIQGSSAFESKAPPERLSEAAGRTIAPSTTGVKVSDAARPASTVKASPVQSSPIPTVRSVVNPILAKSASPAPASTQTSGSLRPLRMAQPSIEDPPEVVTSKFEELYTAFSEEMDNFGYRLGVSGSAIKAAQESDSSGDWTLNDLDILCEKTDAVARQIDYYQEELVALDKGQKELLDGLPQEAVLVTECQRRFEAMAQEGPAKHAPDAPLGPEDESLRSSILQRAKVVERSLQTIADYMERLRCDEQDNESRHRLKKPDWQTICGVANHITRSTENNIRALLALNEQVQRLPRHDGPVRSQYSRTPQEGRRTRGFGLVDSSDDDDEGAVREKFEAAPPEAATRAAFLNRLKALARNTTGKGRVNTSATTCKGALQLQDPETFAKACAAMLRPPSQSSTRQTLTRSATPRSTKEAVTRINAEMRFPDISPEAPMPAEPTLQGRLSSSADLTSKSSFGIGSLNSSVFDTPTKIPNKAVSQKLAGGVPNSFSLALQSQEAGAPESSGWIKIEGNPAQSPALSASPQSGPSKSTPLKEPAGNIFGSGPFGTSAAPVPKFGKVPVKVEPTGENGEPVVDSVPSSESGWEHVKDHSDDIKPDDEQDASEEDFESEKDIKQEASELNESEFTEAEQDNTLEDGEFVEDATYQDTETDSELPNNATAQSLPAGDESFAEDVAIQNAEPGDESFAEDVTVHDVQLGEQTPAEESFSEDFTVQGISQNTDHENSSASSSEEEEVEESDKGPSSDSEQADRTAQEFGSERANLASRNSGHSAIESSTLLSTDLVSTDLSEPAFVVKPADKLLLPPGVTGDILSEVNNPEGPLVEEPAETPVVPAEDVLSEPRQSDENLRNEIAEPSLTDEESPREQETSSALKSDVPERETEPVREPLPDPGPEPQLDRSEVEMDDVMEDDTASMGLASAFGSGFGSLGSQQAPKASDAPPLSGFSAFGSTPPTTGFGSDASTASGFGAFGSAANSTGFGSDAPKASGFGAFGSTAPTTGFGSDAPKASGFGAFGSTAPTTGFGSDAPKASGFGAFGSIAPATFGQTGFGSSAPSMAQAVGASFGSSSTPPSSAFGPSQFAPAGNISSAFGSQATGMGSNVGGLASMANSIKQASQSGGGFGSYAAQPSGFAAFAGAAPGGQSGFGAFGSAQPSAAPAGFGAFGSPQGAQPAQSVFGGGSSPFGQPQQQPPKFNSFGGHRG